MSARPPARDTAARELKFRSLADELRREILAGSWPPGTKLPTERELAAANGLSLTTVRRAFEELVQQRLVSRRQGAGTFVAEPVRASAPRRSVGVMVPDTRLYYPSVLQGIEGALSAAGAGLQLSCCHYDPREEADAVSFLLDSGVDGMLLVPNLTTVADPAGRLAELLALPVPVVLVERSLAASGPADRSEYVCSDHRAGAYDALEHLHRLGHDRIGLITRSGNPTAVAVCAGYREGLDALAISGAGRHSAPKSAWDGRQAGRALDELVAAGATAALVFGDREATLLSAAARRRGLSIPDDLALVSYDDETADVAEVPLTAVAPPKYRVGKLAAQVLLRRLEEGDACPLHQIRLRPRIVVRDSCGARPPDD